MSKRVVRDSSSASSRFLLAVQDAARLVAENTGATISYSVTVQADGGKPVTDKVALAVLPRKDKKS